MKRFNVHIATVADLVDRFAEICVEQNKALLEDEIAKFNRLYDQMAVIREELKTRPGDQRKALLTLFNHSDLQVRLQAAKITLAVEPQAARQMLERIQQWQRQPQAGDAGMCLWALDEGIFVPK